MFTRVGGQKGHNRAYRDHLLPDIRFKEGKIGAGQKRELPWAFRCHFPGEVQTPPTEGAGLISASAPHT